MLMAVDDEMLMVTPEGTIVAFVDREMKPETDPDWEEHVAKRKAKRQRVQDDA